MASPTKQTEAIRKNRDTKIAKNRSKKFRKEAPGANNTAIINKLEKLVAK